VRDAIKSKSNAEENKRGRRESESVGEPGKASPSAAPSPARGAGRWISYRTRDGFGMREEDYSVPSLAKWEKLKEGPNSPRN